MSFKSFKEAYDATKAKMEKQGAPSYAIGGGCAYNNGLGQRCAVGCHLPFQVEAELNIVLLRRLLGEYPELLQPGGALYIEGKGEMVTFEFWERMQRLHDHPTVGDNFMKWFKAQGIDAQPFFTAAQHRVAEDGTR